jgi:hypothetical protein
LACLFLKTEIYILYGLLKHTSSGKLNVFRRLFYLLFLKLTKLIHIKNFKVLKVNMLRKRKLNNYYSKKKKNLLKKLIMWTVAISVCIIICVGFMSIEPTEVMAQSTHKVSTETMAYVSYKNNIKKLNDQIQEYDNKIVQLKEDLTDEVYSYMNKYTNKIHMSPEHIVNECISKDFDIPLLLSQAHQESVFGKYTKGKSCFGVVSRRYKTHNESVTDYINIMQSSYLIKRSPEQLINSGFRMEKYPKYKYASDPNYSKTIARIRTNIIRKTNIVTLVDSINLITQKRDELKLKLNKISS